MFNEKNNQVDRAYIETSHHIIDSAKELAKMLILLTKQLKKTWDEKQKENKIAVKIGEETYNLIEDKDTPGAYKWENVDLNNENSQTNVNTDKFEIEQPFTDYQAQTLATKLITEAPNNINYKDLKEADPAIQIVLSNDKTKIVLYELSQEGECVKNTFAQELGQEKIIDVAYEPLTNILPPNSPLLLPPSKDNQTQEDLIVSADDMLFQVVGDNQNAPSQIEQPKFDVDGLIIEEPTTPTTNSEAQKQDTINKADFIAGTTATQVSVNNNNNKSIVQINESTEAEKVNPQVEEESVPIIKRATAQVEEEPVPTVKKSKTQSSEEPAANYTYQEVASSPEVEPRTQQWARQSTIPIEQIKHRGEQNKVDFEKNKNIANAATQMLKKYGTIDPDGSRIYRSDAFAIRKADGVISIHRRGDEAKGFKEPLIEFKLDKKGTPDIKGTSLLNNLKGSVTQNDMLPVEKQEFLIVAEQLNEGKGLPDLQSGDVREIGNALGSLAPAGTLRTLDTFKKSEMLEMLNSTLNQVKSDEVKAGEFTVKRKRDPKNNRASLILTKDSDDGRGKKELVRFNLEKTPDGIKSEVAKMNISDYDIGQVKHIAQNAYKLDNKNLESNFDNNYQQSQSPLQQTNSNTNSIGDIPVNIHPWIAEEWQRMTEEKPLWQAVVGQDNDEILQKLEQNQGKLPIADQREMYDKIIMHKVTQAQASGNQVATIDYVAKKDITADLMKARSQIINDKFTPAQNISQKARATKREIPRPLKRKQEVEI